MNHAVMRGHIARPLKVQGIVGIVVDVRDGSGLDAGQLPDMNEVEQRIRAFDCAFYCRA